MTHADIVAKFLSEVTDQPVETCAALLAAYQKCFPTLRLSQGVSPREATRLRAKLRKELRCDPTLADRFAGTSRQRESVRRAPVQRVA